MPAAGQVTVLTQSNGKLLNRFRDQCASYYEPFYYVKTVNDYSGAFKNPYWGTWGATVFWGGGHAGTNDNSVTVAEYGSAGITFKRVSSPTPWFGGTEGVDPGIGIRSSNGDGTINTAPPLNSAYGESTIDGQQCSPHSYGLGDIVGPEYGGAQYGTLVTIAVGTLGRANEAIAVNGAIAAHHMPFDTTTLLKANGTYRKWTRLTNNKTPANWGSSSCPFYSAFVGAQNRIYFQSQNDGNPGSPRWFDRATNTYVRGTGVGFSMDSMDGYDSGIMFWVPSRDLLIAMYPYGGTLRIQWMNVAAGVSQPTVGGTATLSQTVAVADPWSAGCWCPHNNRIIVAGVTGDNTAAYEIEIPATLSTAWTVTRAPFAAGQTFTPADPSRGIGLTYKKFHYDEKVRAIVYMPVASGPDEGDDRVWVYRPRGT